MSTEKELAKLIEEFVDYVAYRIEFQTMSNLLWHHFTVLDEMKRKVKEQNLRLPVFDKVITRMENIKFEIEDIGTWLEDVFDIRFDILLSDLRAALYKLNYSEDTQQKLIHFVEQSKKVLQELERANDLRQYAKQKLSGTYLEKVITEYAVFHVKQEVQILECIYKSMENDIDMQLKSKVADLYQSIEKLFEAWLKSDLNLQTVKIEQKIEELQQSMT